MTENLKSSELRITLFSDTHVLPEAMISGNEQYRTDLKSDRKLLTESEGLFNRAVELAEKAGSKIIFISGDMTKDGEYKSHQWVADKLKSFISQNEFRNVFIVPGNHDINNSSAKDYNENGKGVTVTAQKTSPDDFASIYEDIINRSVISFYRDSHHFKSYMEKVVVVRKPGYEHYGQGYLAYASRVDMPDDIGGSGLTIICMDTCRYSADIVDSGKDDVQDTAGTITKEQLKWVADMAEDAEKRGDTIIAIAHHAFMPHFHRQEKIFAPYVLKNWNTIIEDDDERLRGKTPAETLADMGISYICTGHMHAQHIAELNTKAGNRIYDIETGSTITYPLPVRHLTFSRNAPSKEMTLTVEAELIGEFSYTNLDGVKEHVSNGTSYSAINMITPELVGGIVNYYMKLPDYKDLDSKDLMAKFLPDGTTRENYFRRIMALLQSKLRDKSDPGFVNDIVSKKFKAKVEVYIDDIKEEKIYRAGRKIAVDITTPMGKTYPYMITETKLNQLLENTFGQLDSNILKRDLIRRRATELAEKMLQYPVYARGTNRERTFGGMINYAYLSGLRGDEIQPDWIREVVAKYEGHTDSLASDMIDFSKDSIDKMVKEMAKSIVFTPKISELFDYDKKETLGSRLDIVKFAIERKIKNKVGKNLAQTMDNLGYSVMDIVGKALATDLAKPMVNHLDAQTIEIVDAMTGKPFDYQMKNGIIEGKKTILVLNDK
ncbi:MAG: metallophosphoesterase [Tissierellia bacterium]|nr:metallophosphoesterase [Tissierellia bacterium]